jgi:hypothetical protein
MKTSKLMLICVAAIAAIVVVVFIAGKLPQPQPRQPSVDVARVAQEPQAAPAEKSAHTPVEPSAEPMKIEETAPTPAPDQKQAPKAGSKAAQVPKPKEPILDPMAREALAYVGVDPDAEEYWVAAINDPSLSVDERKNLIEDLNEDGLSDPKRPGPQDMPMIWSRIFLIEELAPYSMDDANADAFAEAYKDLLIDRKEPQ